MEDYSHFEPSTDGEILGLDCSGKLPGLAQAGIRDFNRGAYFEAHELLEAAWKEEPGPVRELYRSILQVAVAYYQIERGNFNGARKMFLRVKKWIDPLPPVCQGVNVQKLRQDAERVYQSMICLGPERINKLDRRLFQPVAANI